MRDSYQPLLLLRRRGQQLSFIVWLFLAHLATHASSSSTTEPPFLKDPEHLVIQSISATNTLKDSSGREISLSNVEPYTSLLSPGASTPGKSAAGGGGGKSGGGGPRYFHDDDDDDDSSIDISVYRGETRDGSTILVSKDDNDQVNYVVVTGQDGAPSTHFIPHDEPGTFLTVADDDYDYKAISELLSMMDEEKVPPAKKPTPYMKSTQERSRSKKNKRAYRGSRGSRNRGQPSHRRRRLLESSTRQLQNWEYENGDGTSEECTAFLVIPVTIFFDAEFCQLYGGEIVTTVSTVQMIVAAASLHYENNLCARLELTGIYWDTISCNPDNSIFRDFNRGSCSTYLDDVTDYLNDERSGLGIDSNSYIHVFTGLPVNGNLGCAWLPGPCGSEFVYGVDYMSFQFPDIRGSAFILAHELGHNHNAPHDVPNSPDPPDYIMEQSFNSGADGFSPSSQTLILGALLDPINFCVSIEEVPSAPTLSPVQPTPLPVQAPTPLPVQPTPLPTAFIQTVRPTPSPTTAPPTPPPTLPPTPPPTPPPSPRPTTAEPSPQPTIFVPPTPAPTGCDIRKPLLDPVCVHASMDTTDYTCYDARELLAFETSSEECEARIQVSVNVCTNQLLLYPGSTAGAVRMLRPPNEHDDHDNEQDELDAEEEDDWQRQFLTGYPAVYRPLESETSSSVPGTAFHGSSFQARQGGAPTVPSCNQDCHQVGDMVCFRSTTEPGYDRWYRVRYTAFDAFGNSGDSKSMTVFVVIKENGQAECSFENFLTCAVT